MTVLLILCGCLIGVCVFLAVKYKAAQEEAQERIKVNLAVQQENENLDKENAQLRIDQSSLVSRIDAQKQQLDELQRHTQIQTEYAKMEAKRALDQAYEGYSQEIEQEYRSLIDDEMSSYLSVFIVCWRRELFIRIFWNCFQESDVSKNLMRRENMS